VEERARAQGFPKKMRPAQKKRRVESTALPLSLSVIIPESLHIGEPVEETYGPAVGGVRVGPTTVRKSFELLDMDASRAHAVRLQALNEVRKNLPQAASIPLIRYIHVQPNGIAYVQDKIRGAAPVPKWSMSPNSAASFCESVRAILSVAHRAGLRHRDISPWNVLRSPLGAHLVDWDHHERTQGNLQWAVDAGMDDMKVEDMALLAADSEKVDLARLKALQVWVTKRAPPSYIA
jgi:hypothetical protein